MLFSSTTFIFLFLPAVLAAYYLSRKELRNYVLLAASVLFYAWGEPDYLAIMILTIVINWAGALLIEKRRDRARRILVCAILMNLSFLVYFKYFNFIIENINTLFSARIDFIRIVMPVGISFYTFQAMSYLIDVYRKDTAPQRDIAKLALYITLFPQLIAGPIVKYHEVAEQIDGRAENFNRFVYGVKRFIVGLAKKMLIANTLGATADKVFSLPVEQFDTVTAWIGAAAYSFQLFYDFSGYSDMAIGLGSMFGFKFLENFNYPYISRSITEFWRRWHISLSTWFKEYLYIPLGGNRVSKRRNLFNLLTVFLVTGIWQGASWNFVCWGLWHGIFIIVEKLTGWHKNNRFPVMHHLYCVLVFVTGWVMFRSDTMRHAAQYLKRMAGLAAPATPAYTLSYYVGNIEATAFAIAILCATPVFKNMINATGTLKKTAVNLWWLMLFALSASSIAASTYNPFIYFRF